MGTGVFTIVLRGYDMAQVDDVLTRAEQAVASGNGSLRAAARHELEGVVFPWKPRGTPGPRSTRPWRTC
ncbi:DivIVA domain-containing protein [Actinoplanes sp. DH11]|uniref:DivIVA domain-containing protein n=1 Tax=Actinoplanes sp. DH11 TaxID=2857011 RepID=UPI001E625936|nr:DivIVA domain-containing protein [Actinoplanes sp. DH11]